MGLPTSDILDAPVTGDIPESSASQVFSSAFEEGQFTGTTGSYYRRGAMDDLNEGKKSTPQEIKEEFDIDVDAPTTRRAAFHMRELKEEQQKRSQMMANTTGFWKGYVVPFVGGAAGAMTDPVDFMIGAALGAGIGKAIGATAGTATKVAADFIGMGIENTASEVGNYYAKKKEGLEYTAQEAALNIIAGSVAMTGVKVGGSALFKKIKNAGKDYTEAVVQTMDNATRLGKDPTKTMDVIGEIVEADLKLKPEMKNAVDEVLGERGKSLVESDDINEFATGLRQKVKEGEITAEEAFNIRAKIQEAGIEPSEWERGKKTTKLSTEGQERLQKHLEDPTTDAGYDPEISEVKHKEVTSITEAEKLPEDFDEVTRVMKDEESLTDADRKHLADMDEEEGFTLKDEEEYMKSMDEYYNCAIGGI